MITDHSLDHTCTDCATEVCCGCGISYAPYEEDPGRYCRECAIACEDCDILERPCDMIEVHYYTSSARPVEKWLCADCTHETATRCDICRDYWLDEHMSRTARRESICPNCAEHYFVCDACGELYHEDNIQYDADSERNYCTNCYDNVMAETDSAGMYDYGCGPGFGKYRIDGEEHYREDRKTLAYYGIELETGKGKYEGAEAISEKFSPFLFCQKDSSITGLELTSQPASERYWRESGFQKLFRACAILRENGHEGHGYGGIHIHMSLSAISSPELFRLLDLFYGDRGESKERLNFWLAVSQRKQEALQQWAAIRQVSGELIQKMAEEKRSHLARYVAVNVTENTVEFRLFNSSLKENRIRARFEIVWALLAFVQTQTANNAPLADNNVAEFTRFVKGMADTYANAAELIADTTTREEE